MSSQRKIESARANGRRSRGPVTPEGKQRSSQNARKHGLLASALLLPGESEEGFENLVNEHLARFGDIDGVELAMIEEMCAAYWRMRRAWTLETEAMSKVLYTADLSAVPAVFKDLALLHRYEARLHGMYHRSLRSILQLRKALPLETPPALRPEPASDPSPAPDPPPPDSPPCASLRSSPDLSGSAVRSPVFPNEPNPNSEHTPEPPSPLDSSPLLPPRLRGSASNSRSPYLLLPDREPSI